MSAAATPSASPAPRGRIAVVGGGILGLAIARELLLRRPGATVVVYEKEQAVARHQTGHNSGVVHAGIYYKPGSLKAELCSRGRELLRDYCVEHRLPYQECGKVVVAVHPTETARLDALENTATTNGVPGLRRLGARQLRELEPHAQGVAALHSPQTAITDFVAVAESLAAEVIAGGGDVRLGHEVAGLARSGGRVSLTLRAGAHGTLVEAADLVILCPGLHADRLAALADGSTAPRIVPFRGEYLLIKESKQDLVRGLIYPVPDPRYPFLGVHFTRRVDGRVDIGPNALLAVRREGYARSLLPRRSAYADLRDTLTWPGFWRLAGAHWRTGAAELHGALSMAAFLESARRYVPGIGPDDVTRSHSGIRAQAVDRDGSLVDDFRITHADGVVAIRNAPSPAATSSLAIAEHIVASLPR